MRVSHLSSINPLILGFCLLLPLVAADAAYAIVPQAATTGKVATSPVSDDPANTTAAEVSISAATFQGLADMALTAMHARAEEMKVGGVAVVAYFEGEKIQSWSSKMLVVGRSKDEPKGTEKGSNLIAIAYAKAAEMADTLRNSGSQVRPPMIGEFGWEGGVILRTRTGYLIAAFSGGKSADDVAVSRAGIGRVLEQLKPAP